MSFLPISRKRGFLSIVPVLALSGAVSFAAMNPGFELDQKSLNDLTASSGNPAKKEKKNSHSKSVRHSGHKSVAGNMYTVKQGDNLFRILMREYALSNDEAEALIEDIRRENNISDIKKLKIGQKISIPAFARKADGTFKCLTLSCKSVPESTAVPVVAAKAPLSDQKTIEQVKLVWDQLVPINSEEQKTLKFESPSFSLTLDPQRYPVFYAYNGARIIIDQSASIPPLIKSLIMAKDPKVKIVTESFTNPKRLLAAMLDSAGLYSVEPDFRMEFGVDPRLVLKSDFKIEKNADSLIKQDVILLNSNGQAIPAALTAFLKQEGFSVLEPFTVNRLVTKRTATRQLIQIESVKQYEIVDRILESLSIPFLSQRNVDVFTSAHNGISLSVKVDRFFEYAGKKHVVTSFDGDPISYTLFRVLETTGYRVVILEGKDDFRKVSERMLTSLQMPVDYSMRKMWSDSGLSYSVEMSGYSLEGSGVPGGPLFLTDRPLDPIVKEMLKENGYDVKVK